MTKHRVARVREHLLEAIREVQILAGIDALRSAAAEPPLPLRGFKGVRSSGSSHGATALALVPDAEAARKPRPLAIGVISPDFRDGKSTVAIALASCLAQDFDTHVTLVDADFGAASVAGDFGLEGGDGLVDVLEGAATLQSVTHRFVHSPLSVVTAGHTPASATRIARSEKLCELLDEMKSSSGFVVLDLPAALHSMSAPVFASRCDGVVVVARAGHTSRKDLRRTLDLLRDSNVLGVVVNQYRSRVPRWVERALDLRP